MLQRLRSTRHRQWLWLAIGLLLLNLAVPLVASAAA